MSGGTKRGYEGNEEGVLREEVCGDGLEEGREIGLRVRGNDERMLREGVGGKGEGRIKKDLEGR